MLKLKWAVTCQRALIDQKGALSLVQVIEGLGIPPPPTDVSVPEGALIPFPIAIVTYWSRPDRTKPDRGDVRIRSLAPDGKEFNRIEFAVDLEKFTESRSITELPGIQYHGPGTYVSVVEVKDAERWRRVGTTEFNLVHPRVAATPSSAAPH
jgi:hypothetical protein